MIELVLEEIKLAEKKASDIRIEGDNYATAKNKEAETLSANIQREAELKVKELKKSYKEALVQKEASLYNEVILSAQRDAEALYSSLSSKIDETADEIVGKVFNGDC